MFENTKKLIKESELLSNDIISLEIENAQLENNNPYNHNNGFIFIRG